MNIFGLPKRKETNGYKKCEL